MVRRGGALGCAAKERVGESLQLYTVGSEASDPFSAHRVVEWANNLAEKAILPVAFERRNWIHISSENAGPCVAASACNLKSLFVSISPRFRPGSGDFSN